jgi:hypothetical protein
MIFFFPRRHGIAGSTFVAALCLCIFPIAHAQEGLRAVLPASAVDKGPLPSSQTLSFTLYLPPAPEQQASLMQFLSDVQTPGSPAYHQWLTPVQFGAKFGATGSQLANVRAFAAANNLTVSNVSDSGLHFTLTGTVASVESAMAPTLHEIALAGSLYYANTAIPVLPSPLSDAVTTIGGLSTLPAAYPLMISDAAVSDPLAAISGIVDANALRVLSISGDACLEDFSAATQSALQSELRQASAQGITVLASSGCGSRGSAGFPSSLTEVTAVAVAPGITPASSPTLTELRPAWQNAAGMPADSFRHEVDFTVSSLDALSQKVMSVVATQAENNAPLRLGNINPAIYQNDATKGLFTQPDNAAPGTWEPATGLGLADLDILGNIIFKPHGSHNSQTTVYLNTSYATHGAQISAYATVIDPSFAVGFPPTGNITFTTSPVSTFGGTEPTNNGTSQTYSSNTLNAGSYQVTGSYYGDGTYAGSTGQAGLTIAPEPSVLSATTPGSVNLGQTFTVVVTDRSGSGVDTPYGTITITEYGATTLTYTQNLVTQGTGVATATFNIPAAQGGTLNLSINCNANGGNPNFTCYTPISETLTVGKVATTTALISNPANPMAGQTIALQATVTMTTPVSGYNPVYTGNVTFYDNGTYLGNPVISGSGLATLVTALSGANDNVTAVYSGDSNFLSSTGTLNGTGSGSGSTKTTTALAISPTSGPAGSNFVLTATVANPASSGPPTGTVTFYDTFNGTQTTLGTATLAATGANSSTVQFSTAGLAAGTHNLAATYNGSSTFSGSSSNVVILTLGSYSLTFSPATMTLSAGASGVAVLTVNSISGFTGTVKLACTPPTGTETTCTFNPASITNSGSAQLLITTTPPQASKTIDHAGFDGKLIGSAVTVLLLGLLLPSVRRRRPVLVALLLSCVMLCASGCTELNNVATLVPVSGTPLGTQVFAIDTSTTSGSTTTHIDTSFQVTVQ